LQVFKSSLDFWKEVCDRLLYGLSKAIRGLDACRLRSGSGRNDPGDLWQKWPGRFLPGITRAKTRGHGARQRSTFNTRGARPVGFTRKAKAATALGNVQQRSTLAAPALLVLLVKQRRPRRGNRATFNTRGGRPVGFTRKTKAAATRAAHHVQRSTLLWCHQSSI